MAELYREAERAYLEASRRLEAVEAELTRLEEELAKRTRELIKRYGPGYLTVKSVRNKQGKRYRYPVWRTPSGKDIYLEAQEAEEILMLREERRRLRIQYNKYRKLVWAAKLYMQDFKEYKDTCIDRNGEYVPCPRHG